MSDTDDISDALKELEQLRIEYEKYFIGVEARAPEDQRKVVERKIRALLGRNVTRTSEKFLMQNLRSRFVTMENYWTRVMREMEDGTYFRQKARNRMRAQLAAEKEQAGLGSGVTAPSASNAGWDLSEGVNSGVSKPAARPYSDVFDSYRSAGANVSYDKLADTLKKQEAAIREKYGASRVEFTVKIVDGKPKLSAKPVK